MSFQGTLDTIGLPEVFQLFAFSRKSGALHLGRDSDRGIVYFSSGSVYYATAQPSDALGNVLVRAGLVTPEQWKRVLGRAREDGKAQGEILAAMQDVDAVALEAFVRERVEDAVFKLMQWSTGNFALEDETHTFGAVFSFGTDPLLEEARRRLGVWSEITGDIPSTRMGVGLRRDFADEPDDITLHAEEWRVVATLLPGMSIEELAMALGKTEFRTCQTLHAMLARNLIELHSVDKLAMVRALTGYDTSGLAQHELAEAATADDDNDAAIEADQPAAAEEAAAAEVSEPAQPAEAEEAGGPGDEGDESKAGADADAQLEAEATSVETPSDESGDGTFEMGAEDTQQAVAELAAEGLGETEDGGWAEVEPGGQAPVASDKSRTKISLAELAAQAEAATDTGADGDAGDAYAYDDYYERPTGEAAYPAERVEDTAGFATAAGDVYSDPGEYAEHAAGGTALDQASAAEEDAVATEEGGELDKSLVLRLIAGVRSL